MNKNTNKQTILFGLLMLTLIVGVFYSAYRNFKCTTEPKKYEKTNVNTFHDSLYNDTLVYPFLRDSE